MWYWWLTFRKTSSTVDINELWLWNHTIGKTANAPQNDLNLYLEYEGYLCDRHEHTFIRSFFFFFFSFNEKCSIHYFNNPDELCEFQRSGTHLDDTFLTLFGFPVTHNSNLNLPFGDACIWKQVISPTFPRLAETSWECHMLMKYSQKNIHISHYLWANRWPKYIKNDLLTPGNVTATVYKELGWRGQCREKPWLQTAPERWYPSIHFLDHHRNVLFLWWWWEKKIIKVVIVLSNL